ncbi:MAG: hypothetical protein AABZ47_07970 [Planctomycetota bacterium]
MATGTALGSTSMRIPCEGSTKIAGQGIGGETMKASLRLPAVEPKAVQLSPAKSVGSAVSVGDDLL